MNKEFKFEPNPYLDLDFIDVPVKNALLSMTSKWIQNLINKPDKVEFARQTNKSHLEQIWRKFHPHLAVSTNKYQLLIKLLPLNRVGAVEGASGASVFVMYFDLMQEGKPLNDFSVPMILKFFKLEDGKPDKLKDEYDCYMAISQHIEIKDKFAIPSYWTIEDNISFLLSPFISSSFMSNDPEKLTLEENNLFKQLSSSNFFYDDPPTVRLVKKVVKDAYLYLHSLHKGHKGKTITRTYKEEYKKYLRKLDHPDNSWISLLESFWGKRSQRDIEFFNKSYVNPLYIYDKVINETHNFMIGAVHGDFHPRNLVINFDDSAGIIDFGWSSDNVHIAKDFVLMEANFRFSSLNSKYTFKFASELADTFTLADLNSFNHPLGELIFCLRDSYNRIYQYNKLKVDWTKDYLIPLFLVSLGLLKYTDTHNNLMGTHLTLLKLSDYLAKELDL